MMLPATKTRRAKGIAEVVIIIVILVMAMVAAILVWFFVMPTLSGGSGVTYGLGVTGTGSSDGSRAVISVSIQNTGSKPIGIQGIWISPGGSGAPTDATVSSVQPTIISVTYGDAPPGARPTTVGLVIQPGTSATITIVLTGTGFYRGTPLMVTVYAVDATNPALTNDQSTRFTLS